MVFIYSSVLYRVRRRQAVATREDLTITVNLCSERKES